MKPLHSGLVLLLLVMLVIRVYGQSGDDVLLRARIGYLERALQKDQRATLLWWKGWLVGYGVATVGQGALFLSTGEKALRQDMAVGAITTLAGVAGQFITPFQPNRFADQLSSMPAMTGQEQREKLKQMEEMLLRRAAMETKARRWQSHLLCTSVNLASGLVTWLGFRRTVWDGVANFAFNCLITETQIWSQPMKAKRALRDYHERFGTDKLVPNRSGNASWNLTLAGNSAAILLQF